MAAGRQRTRTVEHADVVEPQEAAAENVFALGILAVHPPGEIQQKLLECAREKCPVTLAVRRRDLVRAPARPCMHGRIDVAECEFVRGNLTVRVHVPLAQEQHELVLRELRIHPRERNHVKRQVPCGVPRIFPFVRHRNYVSIVEVQPLGVTPVPTAGGWRRHVGVALQPVFDDVMVKLLAPEQPGVGLPDNAAFFLCHARRNALVVEFVSLPDTLREDLINIL